jgi:hypothetical protein
MARSMQSGAGSKLFPRLVVRGQEVQFLGFGGAVLNPEKPDLVLKTLQS